MLIYILIFFAKIIEVALMTVRTVLLTKGHKFFASLIGFVEVVIWIMAVSTILDSILDDPLKIVVYAGGFSVGCYLGSWLEEKLALGLITIQVIVELNDAKDLAELLRERNIGVTLLEGDGKIKKRGILMIHAQRKDQARVLQVVEENSIQGVISTTETKVLYGGYGLVRK